MSNDGWSASELDKLAHSVSLMKELDMVTLPSDFVDELIAKQYELNKNELLKMFTDLGTRVAGVTRFMAEDLKGLANLANQYIELLPLKRLSVTVDQSGDNAEIVIVGAGRRIESTECGLAFLSSLLQSYGYAVSTKDVNVGTIRVLVSKSQLKKEFGKS